MKKFSKKTRLYLWLQGSLFRPIIPILAKMNLLVFHYDKKQRVLQNSIFRNREKYYIQRGTGNTDSLGLAGLYLVAVRTIYAYEKMGYASYMDFEDYPCQYSVQRKINGGNNAWEYYFKQPYNITRDKAYGGGKSCIGWVDVVSE